VLVGAMYAGIVPVPVNTCARGAGVETRLLVIPKCGHSSHRGQPEVLIREAGRFIGEPSGA